MTDREQTQALTGELDAIIRRYAAEFNVSTAAAIGVLEILKYGLLKTAFENAEDDED